MSRRKDMVPVRCGHCGHEFELERVTVGLDDEYMHPHRRPEARVDLSGPCPKCHEAGFLEELPADPHGHPEAPPEAYRDLFGEG